jgi:hypothetical protein
MQCEMNRYNKSGWYVYIMREQFKEEQPLLGL